MTRFGLALVAAATICGMALGQAAIDPQRAAVAAKIAPVLADPPATGLLIFGVEPNSQSARAGFQVGDILTIYDAQPVASTTALLQLARQAGAEGRKKMPVIAQRGKQTIDAEFDLAPMGLRLVPVKQGEKRVLWRPATNYKPDMTAINRMLAQAHRYEIMTMGNKTIGWSHTYLTKSTDQGGDVMVMRVQSRLDSATITENGQEPGRIDEKRDIVVSFRLQPNLPIQSIWIQVKDKVVLEADATRDGQLVGARVGVPTAAPLPPDAVSSYLTGLLATTMPLKKAACRQCSYLDAFSLVAAPYADIFCLGAEQLQNSAGQKTQAYHFEQTVFGEVVAEFWLDSKRDLMQTLFSNGVRSTATTREEVLKRFSDLDKIFAPIESLPQRGRNIQAN